MKITTSQLKKIIAEEVKNVSQGSAAAAHLAQKAAASVYEKMDPKDIENAAENEMDSVAGDMAQSLLGDFNNALFIKLVPMIKGATGQRTSVSELKDSLYDSDQVELEQELVTDIVNSLTKYAGEVAKLAVKAKVGL